VYTRCPQCQTVFRITAAQLRMRDGMVRCGRCQNAFRADAHLIERPVKNAKAGGTPRKRAVRKAAHAETPARPSVAPKTGAVPAAARTAPVPARAIATETAPAPLLQVARVRTRSWVWTAGSLALVLLLLGQALVFYGYELAREAPVLRVAVDTLCGPLPCRKLPPIDMRRMDLVETQVTPHPRYDKALRIKATIVNRAERVQPYPRLEVSLIDRHGQLVARRVYPPHDYLRKTDAVPQGLAPQVAANVQLDITSPGAQASGYEILLLPPSE
jgi:predicted Zn finger-like uncharacterized protein